MTDRIGKIETDKSSTCTNNFALISTPGWINEQNVWMVCIHMQKEYDVYIIMNIIIIRPYQWHQIGLWYMWPMLSKWDSSVHMVNFWICKETSPIGGVELMPT